MQHSEEYQQQRTLRKVLDKVIGGRYVEVLEKAEGLAFITAELVTPEDIKAVVDCINTHEGIRQLDGNRWGIKPINYQAYRYIIDKAPLTRRRFVEDRTPLMEVRIHNAE